MNVVTLLITVMIAELDSRKTPRLNCQSVTTVTMVISAAVTVEASMAAAILS